MTLLLVITAVEFSLFARPGAEYFTAFPRYSSPYPVRKGLPPPPLHGGELRPEQVTCPGPPSWSVAQAALGQVVLLYLCETWWVEGLGVGLCPLQAPCPLSSPPEVFLRGWEKPERRHWVLHLLI